MCKDTKQLYCAPSLKCSCLEFESSLCWNLSYLTALKVALGNIRESPNLLGFICRYFCVWKQIGWKSLHRSMPGTLWTQICGFSLLQFHLGRKQRREMNVCWVNDWLPKMNIITHSTTSHFWAIKNFTNTIITTWLTGQILAPVSMFWGFLRWQIAEVPGM